MAETKVIKKAEFKKEWAGPNGVVNYHDVWFEGDTSPWNLGAKDKNPDFLKAGSSLTFEVKDESKRSIKRITELPQRGFGGGAKTPFDSAGVTVGNALSNATLLVAHGVVKLEDIEKITHHIVKIAYKLKNEFAGR